MNYINLVIAFIFLSNPAVNVIDILPDFIGWFLIYLSLSRVRHMSIQMENAALGTVKMAWLTFAGFVCIFLTPQFDGTMTLTITFVINTMKLIWGVPTFKYIFAGLYELASLYGAESIYKPIRRSKAEGISLVEKCTYIFLVSSAILNVIPEFFELSGQSSVILSEGVRNLLSFKPLFYVICIVISLIISIIWLATIAPFTLRINREKQFKESLAEGYLNKITKTGKHRAIELTYALFLVSLSGLFLICVMFDEMNLVPRFLMPAFLCVAALKIEKASYKAKLLKISALVSVAVSLASYVFRWIFVIKYSYRAIERSFEAYDFFIFTLLLLFAELIMFVITQLIFSSVLYKIAAKEGIRESLAASSERIYMHNITQIKKYKKQIIVSDILFFIACTANVSTFISCRVFPQSWIPISILSIIWFVYSYSLYSNIRENIERKYL